jgi:hypothetical protein
MRLRFNHQVKGKTPMENKDMDAPEQEPNIVADAPPVASSKKKKVILVGCGFCVLLFLVCAGIGLPMVARLKEASEKIYLEHERRDEVLEAVRSSGIINDQQAEILSKVQTLTLDGLTSISNEQAESLSNVQFLTLDGITSITDEQAESLNKVLSLSLGGLTSITDAHAESLSKVSGSLKLNGLTSITDGQAESLSNEEFSLELNGLTSITDPQAESLSKVGKQRVDIEMDSEDLFLLDRRLSLEGLTSITDEQAESLSKVKGLLISESCQELVDKYKEP